jgi:hypothetical protein
MTRLGSLFWPRPLGVLLAMIILGPLSLLDRASAESVKADALSIVVSPEIGIQPGVDTPIEIRIEPSGAAPSQCMLIIKGAPAGASLSEGRSFTEGQWVVPMANLSKLKIRSPASAVLSLQLFSLEGQELAAGRVALAASLPRKLTLEERAFAMKLIDKGAQSMEAGNVIVAREFFQRAAERGMAEGAIAMGATFDARELTQLKNGVRVQPDSEQAKMWYEKARQLGSEEAGGRLRLLSGETRGK